MKHYADTCCRPKIIQRYNNLKLESTTMADPTADFIMDIDIKANNIKTVSISSDGLDSFMKDTNPVDCVGVVRNFVSFKNLKGDFVKRRIKAYRRECEKIQMTHEDDVSMSTISFE